MNNYLITIVGATAIGKTALSIKLAQHFNTEIISSDSRQFYKEMRIGTAVPSEKELLEAPHHFIQNRSIFDEYSVGQFEKDALHKLQDLFLKNNIVIMVGGSGLYTQAVIDGLDYFPEINPEIRLNLNQQLENGGLKILQNKLKELDLTSYNTIEIDNPHRLIRALEICIGTGKPYAAFKNQKRVDLMFKEGLLDEAKELYKYKDLNALQTVGYRELFNYFAGNYTLEFAVEEIKKNTRRFAKRQITWNKKDTTIHWFNYKENTSEIIKKIEEKII